MLSRRLSLLKPKIGIYSLAQCTFRYSTESMNFKRKESIVPSSIWSCNNKYNIDTPSTVALPSRYIQGNGIIKLIGNYLQILSTKKCAIVIDNKCKSLFYNDVNNSLCDNNISSVWLEFGGECCYEEVDRLYNISSNDEIDTIISIGGGKSIDSGKLLAHYLDINFVSFPTIASTDAPASSLSVIYTPDHQFLDSFDYQRNPDLVIVDTNIIANSPYRYFAAGIGDALATYYEANACFNNKNAKNLDGGRISLSILNWTQLSSEILFKYGFEASKAVKNKIVNDALDHCVEATIFLSGVGFQNGGLAASHSVAMALTNNQHIHDNYLHGEHVAVGLICQLLLENNEHEAIKVIKLCKQVGLPWNCNQLDFNIDDDNDKELNLILDEAINLWVHSHSFVINQQMILNCLRTANQMEKDLCN